MTRRWLPLLLPWLVLVPLGVAGRGLRAAPGTVFTVNSAADAGDADIGNGTCQSTLGVGTCTLRAAIQEASANPNPDTIQVPAGTFLLTGSVGPEDAGLSGDLDITGTVTIRGAGAGNTFIDGNGNVTGDRVLDVHTGTVDLIGVTIRNGQANGPGGGIANRVAATLVISDTTVTGNAAAVSGGVFGGAIYSEGWLTLAGSTVSTNTNGPAVSAGGGIVQVGIGRGLLISDSTVRGNSTVNLGGGVYVGASVLTMTNSTVSNNHAGHGGGLYIYDSQAALVNSTVSGNSSTNLGGGLFNHTGSTSLFNVTVTNNTADSDATGGGSGGGVSNQGGSVDLWNSMVAGNVQLDLFGGGGIIEVEDDCTGTLTSQGSNLVFALNGAACTITGSFTQAFPLLGPLADNGGPTRTHALLAGSVGIDDGAAGGCLTWDGTLLAHDQRGAGRPLLGAHSLRCDLGAYEFPTRLFVPLLRR